ncbi:MAG: hypothetical protein ACR2MK_06520 [Solirubrobacteraceae bacterium]
MFVLAAALGLAALLVSASVPVESRAFVLGSPNQNTIAILAPGERACEGPVKGSEPVGGVRVWGASVGGPSALEVTAMQRAGAIAARGGMEVTSTPSAYTAALSPALPAGRELTVCVRSVGANPFSLLGSAPVNPAVLMTLGGKQRQSEFSLALLRGPRQSLLASLPRAFARASLFHPGWVGTWTFWLLTLALLATVPLGAASIYVAAGSDHRASGKR